MDRETVEHPLVDHGDHRRFVARIIGTDADGHMHCVLGSAVPVVHVLDNLSDAPVERSVLSHSVSFVLVRGLVGGVYA